MGFVSATLTRRALLRGGCAAAAVLAATLGAVAPAGAAADADNETGAQRFVEQLADQAIAALTPTNISLEERENRARALLNQNFAIPAIGQFVLGRYWRQATDDERSEYLALFEKLIIVTYVDRFSRYSGEKLRVTRTLADSESGDVLVQSQITRPAAQPIEIGWRVRKAGDAFKIVDVLVEGVSMGQTQRSEFSSVIRNNGGSIAALLSEMRRRVDQGA